MLKKLAAGVVLALGVGALLAPAGADSSPQIVDATFGPSVSLSTVPTDVTGWALALGANTRSGGTLVVTANVPYALSVTGEKATLTEWDGSAYVASSPKTLGTPMVVTPTRTGGTATLPSAVLPVTVGTSSGSLVTGLGGGTDNLSLQFAQTVLPTDSALASNTYHNKLTYTASAAL